MVGSETVTLTMSEDSATNVNDYTARILDINNSNYKLTGDSTHAWVITAKELTAKWTGDVFTYNGKQQSVLVELEGVETGDVVNMTVQDTAATDVNTYVAKVLSIDNSNYKFTGDSTHTWKISSQALTPAVDPEHPQAGEYVIVYLDDDSTYTYNGDNQEPAIAIVVDGDTTLSSPVWSSMSATRITRTRATAHW